MKSGFNFLACVCLSVFIPSMLFAQRHYDFQKQGSSMKLQMNNIGAFGRIAYGPFNPSPIAPADSLGLEYPIGIPIEHLYGGGLWVGGKMDTSQVGQPPLHLASVTYEGWAGPYFEFFPGTVLADSFWTGTRFDADPPPGWDAYWQGALPFNPRSDRDYYCTYSDDAVQVSYHVPLHLKVIQSSYAWAESTDSPIIILEYMFMSTGTKLIDSMYVGLFLEEDIGPIGVPNYWNTNFSGYDEELHLGYSHNPRYPSSTPLGVRFLEAPVSLDSLRFTFQWFPGANTPPTDPGKFQFLSSGQIAPDEYPNLSDTRYVLACGPFVLRPPTDPNPDTLVIAVAIVSGHNIADMKLNSQHALDLYHATSHAGRDVAERRQKAK